MKMLLIVMPSDSAKDSENKRNAPIVLYSYLLRRVHGS